MGIDDYVGRKGCIDWRKKNMERQKEGKGKQEPHGREDCVDQWKDDIWARMRREG